MTIASSEELQSGPYNGNGVTVDFDYNFTITADADLVVTRRNADGTSEALTLTTDYTVVGAGVSGGGNITLTAGSKAPSGSTLTLSSAVAVSQTRPFSSQTSIKLSEMEAALDKLTILVRQLASDTGRSIKLPVDSAFDGQLDESDTERAGGVVGFDANGDPYAAGAAAMISASAYIVTLLDDEDAAAARTTLGFDGNVTLGGDVVIEGAVSIEGAYLDTDGPITVASATPYIDLDETDQAASQNISRLTSVSGVLYIQNERGIIKFTGLNSADLLVPPTVMLSGVEQTVVVTGDNTKRELGSNLYAEEFFRVYNDAAAADLGTVRFEMDSAGVFRIKFNDDDGIGTTSILNVPQDAGGATAINFKIQDTQAAVVEAAGDTVSDAQAIVTKEKGDARYLGANYYALATNLAITPSGGATFSGPTDHIKHWDAYLTCLTAEKGYNVGDIVPVHSPTQFVGGSGYGVVFRRKLLSGDLKLRFGNGAAVFQTLHADTGIGVALTNANWDLTVHAYY